MSENQIKKRRMSEGDYYLLAFLVAFVLFYVLQLLAMLIGLNIVEASNPGFIKNFTEAALNPSSMTNLMWGIQNISQFIGEVIIAILIVIFLGKQLLNNIKEFRNDTSRNIALIILGFLSMIAVSLILNYIYEGLGIEGTADNQLIIEAAIKSPSGIFMILTVAFLAPFVEEVIYRMLMFGVLEKKLNLRPIITVITSAVVFAALHAIDIFFFQYFAMGLVLSGIYSYSKNNIFVPIGVHFLNNASVFLYLVMVVI